MPSRAERGECSALHDGVVGARRAGALQAKRVVFLFSITLSPHFVWNSLPALPYSLYKQRESWHNVIFLILIRFVPRETLSTQKH